MGDATRTAMGSPPPLPPTLFHAVTKDDFEGMVRLYATAARDSAISYAAATERRRRDTEDTSSSGENFESIKYIQV